MTITYDNLFEDAVAWNLYATRNPKARAQQWRNLRYYATFMGALTFTVLTLLAPGPDAILLHLGIAASIAALTLLWYLLGYRQEIKRQMEDCRADGSFNSFLDSNSITLAPEGIRFVTRDRDTLVRWHSVKRIDAHDSYLYIYFSDETFAQIPPRAFASAVEKDQFRALIDHYRTAGELNAEENTDHLPVPAAAPAVSPTRAPGTPWWRSRETVDTGEPAQKQLNGHSDSSL